MKYRNKKAIATLIVTTLIFTCGATGVQAAPAADLNIVGNVAAAPISGVSLAVAQANTQTAAEQVALVQNMGVAQIDNYLNVRSEASTDSEVVGIMKNNAVAEITGAVDGSTEHHCPLLSNLCLQQQLHPTVLWSGHHWSGSRLLLQLRFRQ